MVDTPKYIRKEIEKNGNTDTTFINIKWESLLLKCNPISNNMCYIKSIYQKNDISILTHVYSDKEKIAKENFIKKKIGNINVIAVPNHLKKCDFVDAKNNVLVDDYKVNIDHWINLGGIGFSFNNKTNLESILEKYVEVIE